MNKKLKDGEVKKTQYTRSCKATLTPYQIRVFDYWVECCRQAWNTITKEIIFTKDFVAYDGISKKEYACTPLSWGYTSYCLDENGCYSRNKAHYKKDELLKEPLEIGYKERGMYFAPCTRIKKGKDGEPDDNFYYCPITYRYWDMPDGEIGYIKPAFESLTKDKIVSGLFRPTSIDKFRQETQDDLIKIFSPKDDLPKIHSKVMASWLDELQDTLKKWKTHKGGFPKYKRDAPIVLINGNPTKKDVKVLPDDTLTGFATTTFGDNKKNVIKCPGMYKMWQNYDGTIPEITVIKIVKKHSKFELQLTGAIESSKLKIKQTNRMTGIDPGLKHVLNLADGTHVDMPRFYRIASNRLTKLQKQLDNKKDTNVFLWLTDKNRTIQDIRQYLPTIASDKAKKLLSITSVSQGIEIINNDRWLTLKHRLPINTYGNRVNKAKNDIAKLQRKTALQRKHFCEKTTTHLSAKYDVIAIEEGTQSDKLRRKPHSKQDVETGQFLPNGAKAKAGLAQSFADRSIGYITSRLDAKLKLKNGKLVKVPAKDTSQICPVCNHKDPDHSLKNQRHNKSRVLTCTKCGYSADRDEKAAIFILLKGYEQETGQELTLENLGDKVVDDTVIAVLKAKKEHKKCESVAVKTGDPPKSTKKRVSKVANKKSSAPVDNSKFQDFGPLFNLS